MFNEALLPKPTGKRSRRAGFTMMELLVVMLIIAVITLTALPWFRKSAETGRADQAVSTVQMLASTNRLYSLDHGVFASGTVNGCAERGPCNCNPALPGNNCSNPCTLMWCGYLSGQNFGQSAYTFYAADASVSANDPCGLSSSGAPAAHYLACAKRSGGSGVYAGWGYTVLSDGTIQPWPSTNGPPPAPPQT